MRRSSARGTHRVRPLRHVAPRHALRAWPEIARGIARSGTHALLLDFDGTLVSIRQTPEEVRCPPRTRRLLRRLAGLPNIQVGMISGRRARPLERMVGVRGLHYHGVCGAEANGRMVAIRPSTERTLIRARRALQARLDGLPGVRIEDKGVSFTVDFRGARKAVMRSAAGALDLALAGARRTLRVVKGAKTWDVVPRELEGKGAAVRTVMRGLPHGTMGIYIGDDAADEPAFRALPRGITVRVGRTGKTFARYWLRGPAEVFEFLTRIEEALQ